MTLITYDVNIHRLRLYFSDARVAAPLLKSATIHGEHGNIGNTFLYVFQHVTKYGYYPEVRNFTHLICYQASSKLPFLHVLKMCLLVGGLHKQMPIFLRKMNSLGSKNQLPMIQQNVELFHYALLFMSRRINDVFRKCAFLKTNLKTSRICFYSITLYYSCINYLTIEYQKNFK